jgi:tRNA dimethylallyltransferase
MSYLVAVVGPTGVGKSELAVNLARTLDGEIVSADSRQLYRYMDIGTAKPSRQEMSLVPHYLIDVINPDEDFSLARYQEMARKFIKDIQKRGKLPLLVGGSGLYVWSVLEGWEIPRVPPDPELRRGLEERAARIGKDELYHELMKVDPVAARKIDPRNVRRTIRALEVYESTRTPFSQLQHKKAVPFDTLIIGLTADRAELYRRVDVRVDEMIRRGLVAEVEKLINMGYGLDLPAMTGIGYRQIGMFIRGELTLESAVQRIKAETHRFIRHQYSWFRLKDDRIEWFDIQGKVDSQIAGRISRFMRGA